MSDFASTLAIRTRALRAALAEVTRCSRELASLAGDAPDGILGLPVLTLLMEMARESDRLDKITARLDEVSRRR